MRKKILVACDHSHIDTDLQRCLVHLAKSCQVDVAADGAEAFDKLSHQTYDLIIVHARLEGISSRELIESVHYIDPGVPLITLIEKGQEFLIPARGKVRSMPYPFKPIRFLRLVDKLLHKQLSRYRDLAHSLQAIIDHLQQQTGAPYIFLIDENGQISLASGELAEDKIQDLVDTLTAHLSLDQTRTTSGPAVKNGAKRNRAGLYTTQVIDNILLAVFMPALPRGEKAEHLWKRIETAALDTIVAFHRYSQGADSDQRLSANGLLSQKRLYIPLACDEGRETTTAEPQETAFKDEDYINWGLISDSVKAALNAVPEIAS